MSLLFISRPLLAVDHQRLRQHMPETNRLGDLSIKWRRLGEAGLTLVERGQYLTAVRKQAGRLATMSTAQVADDFNKNVLPGMPGGNDRLVAPVVDVDFFGDGPFRSIAYVLEHEKLDQEWSYVTAALDRRNGVNGYWGEFKPHITVATIPASNKEERILDAFWNFAPLDLTLQKAIAHDL